MHNYKWPGFCLIVFLFLLVFSIPSHTYALTEVEELKGEIKEMNKQMKILQEKLEKLESASTQKEEEISEIDERLNKAELHTSSDKLSWGVELKTSGESIHYDDALFAPGWLINQIFLPFDGTPAGGLNGATLAQAQYLMQGIGSMGIMPEKVSSDNDIIYSSKFRLNMKAKVNNQLEFAGRLAAYKVWGDSTGVKFNSGSLGDVTFDGNTASLPHGDTIHLERAYFNYKTTIGNVPVNFSLGRRPSTDGPPLEYGNYSLEGGSPFASIIDWQFDGASLNFGLEELTGIPGADFKLCYGVGFEGDWGNSSSLNDTQPDVKDVHMMGFIATLYDNEAISFGINYAHASDITDGFTGTTVMPFIVSKQDTDGDGTPEYYFEANSGGFISRMEPMTNIGDWDAASLIVRANLAALSQDELPNIDMFLAGSWTHTNPSEVSRNPFYEMMGWGLLSSNGELESHDGYAMWAGVLLPMPKDGRLGFEYNWGSKYWFSFTGAEDSLIGSKAATRGQVYEGYYIHPIFKDNFFIKLGARYYDYKYTGSGNPLGAPVEIDQAMALDSLNAIVDKVWSGYMSATFRW
jgi:hypothetical protein